MKSSQQFVVVPYRQVRGKLQPAEMRPARTEEGALRMAELMAERFAGVIAYEVIVDAETGDMNSPRVLGVFGDGGLRQMIEDLAA